MTTPKQIKDTIYRWVGYDGQILHDVGILQDGSLVNPNHYPDDAVRVAVEGPMSEGVCAEAPPPSARPERAGADVRRKSMFVNRIRAGQDLRSSHCRICCRKLGDPELIARGIGSECWQDVMTSLTGPAEKPEYQHTGSRPVTTLTQ